MIRDRKRRAFTLIELLLVMVILAVLASVAVPIYIGQAKKSKINATIASLSNIENALQNFEVQFDRFPTTEEGLDALVHAPAGLPGWSAPLMKELPTDGWGNTFTYRFPGTKDATSYDLYSWGEDGQDNDGGDGDISKDTK